MAGQLLAAFTLGLITSSLFAVLRTMGGRRD